MCQYILEAFSIFKDVPDEISFHVNRYYLILYNKIYPYFAYINNSVSQYFPNGMIKKIMHGLKIDSKKKQTNRCYLN